MKDFAPYEPSLELKELGFNEPCFGYYVDGELRGINLGMEELGGKEPYYQRFGFHTLSNHDIDNPNKIVVTAPTFSQAFRWFREKYDLVHEISWSKYKGGLNFDYDVFSLVLPTDDELGDEDDIASDKSMETYDSLVDKGFKYKESDTYEEAEVACLNKLIEIVKNKNI